MKYVVLLLTITFIIAGCGPTTYRHPYKSWKTFDNDRESCQRQAHRIAERKAQEGKSCTVCNEIKRCLEEKGWEEVK